MVDNMYLYCSETLNLPVTTNETGFIFPEKLLSKKNNKRIIILPTSSLRKKNGLHNNLCL
jgi:hypothetical protein